MRKKTGIFLVCLMLLIPSVIIASAGPLQLGDFFKKKDYLKLPPIPQPDAPEEGFIIYCDEADGILKAMDEYGVNTFLAIPESPYKSKAGIRGLGACSDNNNQLIFVNNSGLLTIKNFDETETIYQITHPSIPSDWEIIKNEMSVNYNHPDGIYVSGNQDTNHMAVYPDEIPVVDYTAIATFRFIACNVIVGVVVFNYDGTDTYYEAQLVYCPNPYVSITKWENGAYTHLELVHITMTYGNDYEIKVKVSNSQNTATLYLDGVEKATATI